jgi:uncharacterized OB-fold protein
MSTREDWTDGYEVVQLTRCEGCSRLFYLPRARCPGCRSSALKEVAIGGGGVVVAVTHGGIVGGSADGAQNRGIALVDLDEGVRMMANSATEVLPGDRINITVVASPDGGLSPLATPV